jgi:hypothetical protein
MSTSTSSIRDAIQHAAEANGGFQPKVSTLTLFYEALTDTVFFFFFFFLLPGTIS